MRVLVPTHPSRAITRITDALARYAPCEVGRIPRIERNSSLMREVPGERDGDVVVLTVTGMPDHQEALAARCLARGQRYAVVQTSLRTTARKNTNEWRDFWRGAAVVWCYYPLEQWIRDDGGLPIDFNFYHAPLGVDSDTFPMGNCERPFMVCTSGVWRRDEGIGACDSAAYTVGGEVVQVGRRLPMLSPTHFLEDVDDATLAWAMGQSQYVSGLRRIEGFELPAAEGLLCGARPVLYDQPHYRSWYEPWGRFVPEGGGTVEALVRLFREPAPVTEMERAEAARRFDWETLCRGFWERACA